MSNTIGYKGNYYDDFGKKKKQVVQEKKEDKAEKQQQEQSLQKAEVVEPKVLQTEKTLRAINYDEVQTFLINKGIIVKNNLPKYKDKQTPNSDKEFTKGSQSGVISFEIENGNTSVESEWENLRGEALKNALEAAGLGTFSWLGDKDLDGKDSKLLGFLQTIVKYKNNEFFKNFKTNGEKEYFIEAMYNLEYLHDIEAAEGFLRAFTINHGGSFKLEENDSGNVVFKIFNPGDKENPVFNFEYKKESSDVRADNSGESVDPVLQKILDNYKDLETNGYDGNTYPQFLQELFEYISSHLDSTSCGEINGKNCTITVTVNGIEFVLDTTVAEVTTRLALLGFLGEEHILDDLNFTTLQFLNYDAGTKNDTGDNNNWKIIGLDEEGEPIMRSSRARDLFNSLQLYISDLSEDLSIDSSKLYGFIMGVWNMIIEEMDPETDTMSDVVNKFREKFQANLSNVDSVVNNFDENVVKGYEQYLRIRNFTLLNNLLYNTPSKSSDGTESLENWLWINDEMLSLNNYTKYLSRDTEFPASMKNKIPNIILERFSRGNLNINLLEPIFQALGIDKNDYSITEDGTNYIVSFKFNNSNYTMTCKKSAAESSFDNKNYNAKSVKTHDGGTVHRNGVYTNNDLTELGLTQEEIDKYFTVVATKDGTPTYYIPKETENGQYLYDMIFKDVYYSWETTQVYIQPIAYMSDSYESGWNSSEGSYKKHFFTFRNSNFDQEFFANNKLNLIISQIQLEYPELSEEQCVKICLTAWNEATREKFNCSDVTEFLRIVLQNATDIVSNETKLQEVMSEDFNPLDTDNYKHETYTLNELLGGRKEEDVSYLINIFFDSQQDGSYKLKKGFTIEQYMNKRSGLNHNITLRQFDVLIKFMEQESGQYVWGDYNPSEYYEFPTQNYLKEKINPEFFKEALDKFIKEFTSGEFIKRAQSIKPATDDNYHDHSDDIGLILEALGAENISFECTDTTMFGNKYHLTFTYQGESYDLYTVVSANEVCGGSVDQKVYSKEEISAINGKDINNVLSVFFNEKTDENGNVVGYILKPQYTENDVKQNNVIPDELRVFTNKNEIFSEFGLVEYKDMTVKYMNTYVKISDVVINTWFDEVDDFDDNGHGYMVKPPLTIDEVKNAIIDTLNQFWDTNAEFGRSRSEGKDIFTYVNEYFGDKEIGSWGKQCGINGSNVMTVDEYLNDGYLLWRSWPLRDLIKNNHLSFAERNCIYYDRENGRYVGEYLYLADELSSSKFNMQNSDGNIEAQFTIALVQKGYMDKSILQLFNELNKLWKEEASPKLSGDPRGYYSTLKDNANRGDESAIRELQDVEALLEKVKTIETEISKLYSEGINKYVTDVRNKHNPPLTDEYLSWLCDSSVVDSAIAKDLYYNMNMPAYNSEIEDGLSQYKTDKALSVMNDIYTADDYRNAKLKLSKNKNLSGDTSSFASTMLDGSNSSSMSKLFVSYITNSGILNDEKIAELMDLCQKYEEMIKQANEAKVSIGRWIGGTPAPDVNYDWTQVYQTDEYGYYVYDECGDKVTKLKLLPGGDESSANDILCWAKWQDSLESANLIEKAINAILESVYSQIADDNNCSVAELTSFDIFNAMEEFVTEQGSEDDKINLNKTKQNYLYEYQTYIDNYANGETNRMPADIVFTQTNDDENARVYHPQNEISTSLGGINDKIYTAITNLCKELTTGTLSLQEFITKLTKLTAHIPSYVQYKAVSGSMPRDVEKALEVINEHKLDDEYAQAVQKYADWWTRESFVYEGHWGQTISAVSNLQITPDKVSFDIPQVKATNIPDELIGGQTVINLEVFYVHVEIPLF